MQPARILIAMAMLTLAGCGTSTRVDEWRCQPQQGIGCVTIADADRPRTSDPSSAAATMPAKTFGIDGILARLVGSGSVPSSAPATTTEAVRRVPDVIARVYVAPFEEAGFFVEENFVWIVLHPSHWESALPLAPEN